MLSAARTDLEPNRNGRHHQRMIRTAGRPAPPPANTSKRTPGQPYNFNGLNVLPPGHAYSKYEQTAPKPRVKSGKFRWHRLV
jgi:hypothetical protein